jgi:methylase of polypeptide subunit release factors
MASGHSSSTTLVVVGDDEGGTIRELTGHANVRAASLAGRDDEEIARWTRAAATPYLVHDVDPLEHVAAAWVEFFDDRATLGALELEIERAVDALRRGSAAIPDYYLVVNPETMPPTWRHWWMGVMAQASPTRVIPRSETDPPVTRLLRRLPTGRAWPEPAAWLGGVTSAVPDRVGLGGAA